MLNSLVEFCTLFFILQKMAQKICFSFLFLCLMSSVWAQNHYNTHQQTNNHQASGNQNDFLAQHDIKYVLRMLHSGTKLCTNLFYYSVI